jgi:hypothetical protein
MYWIAASTLVARKSEISKLRDDLQARQAQLSKEKEQNLTLQSRYQSVQEGKGSTEAKAQEVSVVFVI